MDKSTISYSYRKYIRSKIKPFDGWSPDQRRFAVGWRKSCLTFQEIMDDLKNRIISDLIYFQKLERHHIPDLLQQGWLRLWQALYEKEHFLASMRRLEAVNFVANRCGVYRHKSYLKRYSSYHDFSAWEDSESDTFEDSITAIVIGSSFKSSGKPGHALFSRVVDRMIDIVRAIRQVAEWCSDDIRKLAALYYVTTNVTQADAGRIAGLSIYKPKDRNPRCQGMYRWSKLVLEKLRETLNEYLPIEPNSHVWKECLKAGDTEPVVRLAEKYRNEPDKLLALYSLITKVARHTLVKELGMNDSKLWYAMQQIRQELRTLYARRAINGI